MGGETGELCAMIVVALGLVRIPHLGTENRSPRSLATPLSGRSKGQNGVGGGGAEPARGGGCAQGAWGPRVGSPGAHGPRLGYVCPGWAVWGPPASGCCGVKGRQR